MFDNQHDFKWNPADAHAWLRELESMRRSPKARHAQKASSKEGAVSTAVRYPSPAYGPLDPFGRDD